MSTNTTAIDYCIGHEIESAAAKECKRYPKESLLVNLLEFFGCPLLQSREIRALKRCPSASLYRCRAKIPCTALAWVLSEMLPAWWHKNVRPPRCGAVLAFYRGAKHGKLSSLGYRLPLNCEGDLLCLLRFRDTNAVLCQVNTHLTANRLANLLENMPIVTLGSNHFNCFQIISISKCGTFGWVLEPLP